MEGEQKKPSESPAQSMTASANAVRWSVGVVAHNEGTQEDGSSRLRTWLLHWTRIPNVAEFVIILHDTQDDSEAICREFGIEPFRVNVAGLMECILWETMALARPDCWHLRMGGIDEFITADHLERIAGVIRANPGVRLYWVARRNFCDGVDVSGLLGPDWQLDLMLPQPPPLDRAVAMHSYPRILLHGNAVGFIDPGVAYIEHRRTFEEIEKCNRARDGYASAEMIQRQERFIAAVRDLIGKAGAGGGGGTK